MSTGQLAAGLDGPGVAIPAEAYAATLILQASPDAAGTFVVDLLHDEEDPAQRTSLFATPARAGIEVADTTAAVIRVQPAARLRSGEAGPTD